MNFLIRAIKDIIRGDNIDLYLMILAGLSVALLNLFGLAPSHWVGPITLGMLSLIAFSSLKNRQLLESNKNSSQVFIKKFTDDFESDFSIADDILVIGISLNSQMSSYTAQFEEKIRQGYSVNFLFLHPEGSALEVAVSRALWENDINVLRAKILSGLEIALSLGKRSSNGSTQTKTIKAPIAYQAYLMNYKSSSKKGVIYMENFPYKSKQPRMPKHIFREGESEWYYFFRDEILALWGDASNWDTESIES